jgi:tetratricopeptide (TPR) repeat protein
MAKKKSKKRKKKQKLNTRLLLIIALLAGGIAVLGGGLFWYQSIGRVSSNIKSGDLAHANGDYVKASKYYGRVLYRQPDHKEAIDKILLSYEQIIPLTREEAKEFYDARYRVLRAKANNLTPDAANYKDIMDETYYAARVTNSDQYWNLLKLNCDDVVRLFPKDAPIYSEAKLYLGMCELRLRDGEMTDDLQEDGHIAFPGEFELEEHLELSPDSDEGRASLAFGRLAVARRLELEGRVGQAARNLEIAEQTYEEAMQRNPNGIATAIMSLRDAVIRKIIQSNDIQNDRGSVSQEEIDALNDRIKQALDHAEAIVMRDPGSMPIKVQELLMFYKRADLDQGAERAIAMLDAYLEAQPDDIRLQIALADALLIIGDHDRAAAVAQQALDTPQRPISLMSLEQFTLRLTAASLLFEIAYDRWLEAEADEREALYATMESAREVLDEQLDGDSENRIALNADARLAMARSEYRRAAGLFERLILLHSNITGSIYRNAAICLERIGQDGIALERLENALNAEPMQLSHYIAKAMLEGRLRRPEAGIRTLESLPPGMQVDNELVRETLEGLRMIKLSQDGGGAVVTDPVLLAIAEAERAGRIGRQEEALSILQQAAAQQSEPDARLFAATAQVQFKLGNLDEAQDAINTAYEMSPDNSMFRALRVLYSGGNSVDLIREESVRMYPDDEMLRNESMFVTLNQMVTANNREAAQLEAEGQLESAQLARESAAKALEAMEELRPKVMATGISSNQGIFAVQFEEAVEAGDWQRVEALVNFGREANIDEAGGNLIAARMYLGRSLEEEDADKSLNYASSAAQAARKATEVSPWSDTAWLTLGMAFEEVGNEDEAVAAYEQAYRCNPNNPRTAQIYSSILLRRGDDPVRALRILQSARALMPDDDVMREAWLEAEREAGNMKVVLVDRTARMLAVPSDRTNKLRMASLLVDLPTSRELMVDEYGQDVITDRQWAAASAETRQRWMEELRQTWDAQIEEVLAEASQSSDLSLRQALVHAEIYRELGRRNAMVAVIKDYLSGATEEEAYIVELLSAANFMLQADRAREAIDLLRVSLPDQDPKTRPIDLALAQFYGSTGNYRKALEHLESTYAATQSAALNQPIAVALIRLGRFEAAADRIDVMIGDQPPGYDQIMLLAELERERADVAGAQGDAQAQQAYRQNYRSWLEKANQVDSSKLTPYTELVNSLLLEYSITRSMDLLDQARFIVDRGLEEQPDSDSLIAKRADVLEAQGDITNAVLDLESMLRKYPSSSELRERLVLGYLKAGQQGKAEALLRDAIALDPSSGRWYRSLGDFYQSLSEPDLINSTAAYLEAYRKEPTRSIVMKLRGVTRTGDRWDYDAMIELIQRSGMQLSQDPQLGGLYARALGGKGAYERADQQLKRNYPLYVAAIEAERLPLSSLREWYEDLYAVYVNRDPEAGNQLALDLAGDKRGLWQNVGHGTYWALYGKPGLPKAIEYQKRALEQTDESNSAFMTTMMNVLGSYQIANDQRQDAADTFKGIIDRYPDDPSALNNYAYILAKHLDRPEEALPYAERAVTLAPDSLDILDTMATLHTKMGEHEKAMVSRLRQYALAPENASVALEISRAYIASLDDPQRGLEFAKLANKIMPKDPEVMDALGWAYYQSGEQSRGEELIRASIKQRPTSTAHLHMAQILIVQGREDKARAHLEAGMDLSPDATTYAEIERIQDDIGSS